MIKKEKSSTKENLPFILLVLVFFVASTMRGPMGCIGPLMNQIRPDRSLNGTTAGLLTTLPLLLFALSAPISVIVSKKIGNIKLIAINLAFITTGILVRSLPSTFFLFAGTVLIGIGTGFLNVIVPAFFKENYANESGKLMGIYSSSLTFTSALTAAIVEPLASACSSWEVAFALFSIPSLIAFFLALAFVRRSNENEEQKEIKEEDYKLFTKRNFLIAIYMGFQSLLFFTLLTWFPTIASSSFFLPFNKGLLITIMQLSSIVPAYFVPVVCKESNVRAITTLLALLFIPGMLFCILGKTIVSLIIGAIIMGFSLGSTFSGAITLCAIYGKDGRDTASIISFGQCIGYILASFGPTGFGLVNDISSSWLPVMIALCLIASIMGIVAMRIKR